MWAGQALGLATPSAEPSCPLQRSACVACQACQHAWRAQQVRGRITRTLRFKLVACSSLLPLFFSFQQCISSSAVSASENLSFHCPCPNTASSHTFPIHHLTTAPHQAMHQGNMSGLVQNKLFQKSLLTQNLEGLPPLLQALYGTATSTIQTNSTGIVSHRPCHRSSAWRKGWLLTTVKLGISESLHWAVNISTSA